MKTNKNNFERILDISVIFIMEFIPIAMIVMILISEL